MRPFNDPQKKLHAKLASTNTSFQKKTKLGQVPSMALSLTLLALSAAIPAALLSQKQEEPPAPAYLEVDVSGDPGRLASYRREAGLQR
jgi:predicted lysophospholipase L1 biosynthesis ABC-type transport system permease subunit